MRTSSWAVLLLCACSSPRIVDDDGSTGETGDDDGDDDGVEPDGLYVDCSMLGPNEPTVGPGEPGPLGFPIYACNPRSSGVSEGGHRCCSTNPATADGALPAYENLGIVGSPPLYADAENDAGTWGMCVRTDDVGSGLGLLSDEAAGCPMPCNPTWSFGDISSVCGPSRSCCQAIELGPKDCVRDETGTWRAVTGADIGNSDVTPITTWNAVAHDTHQDPNGSVCQAFADHQNTSAFAECIRHLGVADQRGYCMALGPGQACPSGVATYVDVCETMN